MDHQRRAKNIYVCPGQYFFYIPYRLFVALPGDTIHAGGFCFGRKFKCPMKKTSKQKKDIFRTSTFISLFVVHLLLLKKLKMKTE